MELLLVFLVAFGLIGEDEAQYLPADEIEEIRLAHHDDLFDEFGDEYLSIIGTDNTQVD